MARRRDPGAMQVSMRVDYAMRAMCELTVAYRRDRFALINAESIAIAQDIPYKVLESLLRKLRDASLIVSQRGAVGGYRLLVAPTAITVADVVTAIEGPVQTTNSGYVGSAARLGNVWRAADSALRKVYESVTLEELVAANAGGGGDVRRPA